MVQLGQIKSSLAAYIKRIEEAEKRDHRKIGKALDLFHMQGRSTRYGVLASNGWTIYQVLSNTCVKFNKTMVTLKFVPTNG